MRCKINPQALLSEAQILKQILQWLSLERIWHRRINTQGIVMVSRGETRMRRNPATGMPDLLLCIDGRLVAIEVKSRRGRVSPEQDRTLSELAGEGASVCVARSLEDVMRFITTVRDFAILDETRHRM